MRKMLMASFLLW